MLTRTLTAVAVLASPLAASAQTGLSAPIAYFSPQRAFAASPEGKDVEAKLTALQAQRSRELDARNQKLKALQDAQAEFLGVRRQSESAFIVRLQPALAAVAKERRLLLVVNEDEGLIAWADPVADITAEVVKRLEPVAARELVK